MHYFLRLKIQFIFNLSLFFLSFVSAENNTSITISTFQPVEYNTSIDKYHKKISNQVLYWSNYLDTKISDWFISDERNSSCVPTNNLVLKDNTTDDIDSFFQSNRYLNESRDIYVRLRLNTYYYSRESNKMNMRINAQLPFDRCKKHWNLFFQENNSNKNEIKSTDISNGGVGIRYYGKERYGIKSNYSLGISKGSSYLRVRYKFPLLFGTWKIEPVQIFEYSHKYYFEEESNIYFDKTFNTKDLFRIQLHRKSAYNLKGIDYGLTFQYYWNLGKDSGLEITQSFFGNTSYNDFYTYDKDYSRINNYVSSISWRENIWRKWFYYEIKPSINFHKDHDYKPSYAIRFSLDFYFGDYH